MHKYRVKMWDIMKTTMCREAKWHVPVIGTGDAAQSLVSGSPIGAAQTSALQLTHVHLSLNEATPRLVVGDYTRRDLNQYTVLIHFHLTGAFPPRTECPRDLFIYFHFAFWFASLCSKRVLGDRWTFSQESALQPLWPPLQEQWDAMIASRIFRAQHNVPSSKILVKLSKTKGFRLTGIPCKTCEKSYSAVKIYTGLFLAFASTEKWADVSLLLCRGELNCYRSPSHARKGLLYPAFRKE